MGADDLLLPAQRRPDLPRDRRRAGGLDQQHLRRVAGRRVQPPGHPVLQPRPLRPLLHGLRRHRARHRLQLRGHDLREEQRGPDRRPRLRAVRDAVGDAVTGRDPQARDPRGVGLRLARGLPAGRGRLPRAQRAGQRDRLRGQPAGARDPGARHEGAPLLRDRGASVEAARGAGHDPPPAADGRGRVPAQARPLGAGLHPLRPAHARPVDAAGHLVRADGPDAEALGAGDAQRGHLHPVPLLLRRDRLEPAAAVQRARRLLGPLAEGAGARRGRAGRPGRPGAAG